MPRPAKGQGAEVEAAESGSPTTAERSGTPSGGDLQVGLDGDGAEVADTGESGGV